jgi:hypothetical protein
VINIGAKIKTLFWTAIIGLILTTIYSIVIVQQGLKTKKMITFIYKNIAKKSSRNLA